MIKNSLGRELPERIGDYIVKPYMGPNATPASDTPVVTRRTSGHRIPGESKMQPDLKSAILASGLKDGMTISFHHSFREGDKIIVTVYFTVFYQDICGRIDIDAIRTGTTSANIVINN